MIDNQIQKVCTQLRFLIVTLVTLMIF